MTDTTRIDVCDGKYSVLHENGANLRALRYGESWDRDLTGDGFVLALVQEIEHLNELTSSLMNNRNLPRMSMEEENKILQKLVEELREGNNANINRG